MLWLSMLSVAPATWSVVAVDEVTGEVGVAGATCGPMVWWIAGVAPGEGVIAAQYDTWLKGRDRGVELLQQGASPAEVIETLRAEDETPEYRQYGVAAVGDEAAAWMGREVEDFAGAVGGGSWSVQGNTLASEEVLSDTAAAMEGEGELADRLMAAIDAGAAAGGDSRCDPEDAAKSAFLYVADPGDDAGDPKVEIRASGKGAVAELSARYAEGWRGCSAAPGAGSGLVGVLAGLFTIGRRASRSLRM